MIDEQIRVDLFFTLHSKCTSSLCDILQIGSGNSTVPLLMVAEIGPSFDEEKSDGLLLMWTSFGEQLDGTSDGGWPGVVVDTFRFDALQDDEEHSMFILLNASHHLLRIDDVDWYSDTGEFAVNTSYQDAPQSIFLTEGLSASNCTVRDICIATLTTEPTALPSNSSTFRANSTHSFFEITDSTSASPIMCRTLYCRILCAQYGACASLSVTSTSESLIIECAAPLACLNVTMRASNASEIRISCSDEHSCIYNQIAVFDSADVEISCSGEGSCIGSLYAMYSLGVFNMTCGAEHSCARAEINIETEGRIALRCSGYGACAFLSLTSNRTAETALSFDTVAAGYSCNFAVHQAALAQIFCGSSSCIFLDFYIDADAAIFDFENEEGGPEASGQFVSIDGSNVESTYVQCKLVHHHIVL